jgi:hypothetical protein
VLIPAQRASVAAYPRQTMETVRVILQRYHISLLSLLPDVNILHLVNFDQEIPVCVYLRGSPLTSFRTISSSSHTSHQAPGKQTSSQIERSGTNYGSLYKRTR